MATYLQFLAAFVAPPLLALAALRARDRREDWGSLAGVGVLVVLALAYTTPWDHYLIRRGVWAYGADAVLATLWFAPIEEYAFVAMQTVVAGLWVQHVSEWPDAGFTPTKRDAAVGALAGLAITAAGVAFLGTASTFYLGAILAWAGPVLALQWSVGWRYLLARPRTVAVGVGVPTLYFATVDRIALADGIWTISAEYTTGVAGAGLPVEEGAFFLVTNLFVVQGLVLYDWVVARWA